MAKEQQTPTLTQPSSLNPFTAAQQPAPNEQHDGGVGTLFVPETLSYTLNSRITLDGAATWEATGSRSGKRALHYLEIW